MLAIPTELATANVDLINEIDALVAEHGTERDALIPVLQALREKHHVISDIAMQVVADRLDIPAVEVHGVVSFYAFLGTAVTGQHVISLCRTLSCQMAGIDDIATVLEKELGVSLGGTTADGKVTLQWANCIGQCDKAPAALVDHEALGTLTPDRVREIVAGLRK
jgi:NADH:ubiquinone oxidoreductase subunit E